MEKHVKLKEKQNWAIEKPKLDNARRLRDETAIDRTLERNVKERKAEGEAELGNRKTKAR